MSIKSFLVYLHKKVDDHKMIDLRKEGDKPKKTYNKYIDAMPIEQRAKLSESDNTILATLAAKEAHYDPQNPQESTFYKQLINIVTNGKNIKPDLDELREEAINKIMKDKNKSTIESMPDINDAIKKINSLMLNTGGNGHVTNSAYLNALSTLSNMLIDVKETVERRDRELLKAVHELSSSNMKNTLLDLLDK